MRERQVMDTGNAAGEIARAMHFIYRQGMTTASGGNMSVIDENGNIWITPTAFDKGSLKPVDIICVSPDGTVSEIHKPSSEYPVHLAIYNAMPGIRALIHSHSPALVSFSIMHRVPDTSLFRYSLDICGPAGYAEYDLPGSKKLGEKIASEFRKGHLAVIMENHAAIAGGTDLRDALDRLEAFEYCARTILSGRILDDKKIPEAATIEASGMKTFSQLPETDPVDFLPTEKQKRKEICEIVHRACQKGLMFSRCGTVSVRLKDDNLLVTPEDVSMREISEDNIVRISCRSREIGKKPSAATPLHQQIYKRFPSVNSVIQAMPPYLMACAISSAEINVRTIPESLIFLQEIPVIPPQKKHDEYQMIIDTITDTSPAVLIRNDSIVITGDRLFDCFNRLEVAEMNAMSVVMAKPAGGIINLNNEQVDDLRRVFLKKQQPFF